MVLKFLSRGSMKGEKATMGTSIKSNMSIGSVFRITMRLFQFVMGLVIIGLYAQDLDRARKAGVGPDSKWAYATFCGTWGALFSLIFMTPWVKAWFFCPVDFLAFLFYLVAFGMFGKMYIKEDPEGNKGIIRMKHAVWVLVTNMILWLITAVYGSVVYWKHRKGRTVHTGAASSHV